LSASLSGDGPQRFGQAVRSTGHTLWPGTLHRMTGIRAVLVDVGGTLWPDGWPAQPGDGVRRRERLRAAFPGLGPEQAAACVAELDEAGGQVPGTLTQDPGSYITPALRRYGLGDGPDQVAATLSAMCLPAASRLRLFPGAVGLLASINDHGLPCVTCSNAIWRNAAAYWHDLHSLGIAEWIGAVVSSADTGFRKPHPAMFLRAAAAAGVAPQACLMIGNSQDNDILPARSLGIRTLLVAIEEPPPAVSAASRVAGSLTEATCMLQALLAD
jgi:HAD superfamily hydrolase (TIGR01509 family)